MRSFYLFLPFQCLHLWRIIVCNNPQTPQFQWCYSILKETQAWVKAFSVGRRPPTRCIWKSNAHVAALEATIARLGFLHLWISAVHHPVRGTYGELKIWEMQNIHHMISFKCQTNFWVGFSVFFPEVFESALTTEAQSVIQCLVLAREKVTGWSLPNTGRNKADIMFLNTKPH